VTDAHLRLRFRRPWSFPSPRGVDPVGELQHEKFRRAMQKFETHIHFNEPNKADGRYAPNSESVRECMRIFEQESDGLLQSLFDAWQRYYKDNSEILSLTPLWRKIGELHSLLKSFKVAVAETYDKRLEQQYKKCGWEDMVIGTGVAEMIDTDEMVAASVGFGASQREYSQGR